MYKINKPKVIMRVCILMKMLNNKFNKKQKKNRKKIKKIIKKKIKKVEMKTIFHWKLMKMLKI